MTAAPSMLWDAIATKKGLAGWWTRDVRQFDETLDGAIVLGFEKGAISYTFTVKEALESERLVLACVDGAPEWVGTTLYFEIASEGEGVRLTFVHDGWHEESDFFARCNSIWGHLLYGSLRSFVTYGTGDPLE